MHSPQQTTVAVPSARHSARMSGTVRIPPDHNTLYCAVDRTNLSAEAIGDVAEVRIDLSLDGGITWSPDPNGESPWPWGAFPIKFTVAGGALPDLFLKPVAQCFVRHGILAAPNQQLRATLTPRSVITTSVTITTANGAIHTGAL